MWYFWNSVYVSLGGMLELMSAAIKLLKLDILRVVAQIEKFLLKHRK